MSAIMFFALPFPIELPDQLNGFATPAIIAIDIGLALLVVLFFLFLLRLIRVGRHLRDAGREGRRISKASQEPLPLTSFRRNGVAWRSVECARGGDRGAAWRGVRQCWLVSRRRDYPHYHIAHLHRFAAGAQI